jgi:hypothetical protein
MSAPPPPPPASRGGADDAWSDGPSRRWSRIKDLPLVVRIPLFVFGLGFVILAVLPWEGMWRSFRSASRPVQLVVVVVLAGAVVAAGQVEPPAPPPSGTVSTPTPSEDLEDVPPAETAATQATEADEPPALYPERLDRRARDHERRLGEPVEHNDLRVAAHGFRTDGPGRTLAIAVSIRNEGTTSRHVSQNDWKLQTPSGRVITTSFQHFSPEGELRSAEVLPTGEATGEVLFNTEGETGTFYVLWDPSFQRTRGVWQLTVSP